MISGITFDRPDRLSRLGAFPYHCFKNKIFTVVPIVRIELNSDQSERGRLSRLGSL